MRLPSFRESPYSQRNAPWLLVLVIAYGMGFAVMAAGMEIGWW